MQHVALLSEASGAALLLHGPPAPAGLAPALRAAVRAVHPADGLPPLVVADDGTLIALRRDGGVVLAAAGRGDVNVAVALVALAGIAAACRSFLGVASLTVGARSRCPHCSRERSRPPAQPCLGLPAPPPCAASQTRSARRRAHCIRSSTKSCAAAAGRG